MSVKDLEQAIYNRLTGDATLNSLVGHGVWNVVRPTALFDTGVTKSWITFRVWSGGEPNRAPGRWKDIQVQIMAHAHADEGSGLAFQIDNRIGELIHGWKPTLPGWPNTWETVRRFSLNENLIVKRKVWRYSVGAVYRFRFGEN